MGRNRLVNEDDVNQLAHLLGQIVGAIVDYPQAVSISGSRASHSVQLEFDTADEDAGKVLGKEGKNFQAIETIMIAAAKTRGGMVYLRYRNRDG